MENIEIVEIRVSALPGALIGKCIQESIQLAATEWRNVRLRHNDKQYIVLVNDLLSTVMEIGDLTVEEVDIKK